MDRLTKNVGKRVEEAALYSRRFGTFTKSDYEILMFTAYLDSLEQDVRDYDISIALGITESKVRSLRLRSQLLYPREIKWQEELGKLISKGHYDAVTKTVTMTFEDPSVQALIKNKIESEFGSVGKTLNAKQLVLPIESFVILAAYADGNREKTLKELNKKMKKELKDTGKIEKKSIWTRFLSGANDVVGFLSSVQSVYGTCGSTLIRLLLELVQNGS